MVIGAGELGTVLLVVIMTFLALQSTAFGMLLDRYVSFVTCSGVIPVALDVPEFHAKNVLPVVETLHKCRCMS